jgi:hypothetical protein
VPSIYQTTKLLDQEPNILTSALTMSVILTNEEIIKTLFVKSENNAADIFTKNVTKYLFLKHTSSYMNHLADEKHHTYVMIEEEEEDEVDDHPIVF